DGSRLKCEKSPIVSQNSIKMGLFICTLLFLISITFQTVSTNESSTPTEKETSCNITGMWRNELGSRLYVKANGSKVSGVYHTAVESMSNAAGENRIARVTGFVGEGAQPTVSFSVLWKKGSCSAWVGQCFVLHDGGEVLKTFWMLRSVSDSLAEDWGSTRLGEDVFFKT
ncbi:hypothetical protein DNTS_003436, partial [Danionella cerebrum]